MKCNKQIRYIVEFDKHEWYFNDTKTAIIEAKKLISADKDSVKVKEVTEVISEDYKVTRESEHYVNFM